jgi:hypothetical protein
MPIIDDANKLKYLVEDAQGVLVDIFDGIYSIAQANSIIEEKLVALQEIEGQLDLLATSMGDEHKFDVEELKKAYTDIGSAIGKINSYLVQIRRSEEYQREYYGEEKAKVEKEAK